MLQWLADIVRQREKLLQDFQGELQEVGQDRHQLVQQQLAREQQTQQQQQRQQQQMEVRMRSQVCQLFSMSKQDYCQSKLVAYFYAHLKSVQSALRDVDMSEGVTQADELDRASLKRKLELTGLTSDRKQEVLFRSRRVCAQVAYFLTHNR